MLAAADPDPYTRYTWYLHNVPQVGEYMERGGGGGAEFEVTIEDAFSIIESLAILRPSSPPNEYPHAPCTQPLTPSPGKIYTRSH